MADDSDTAAWKSDAAREFGRQFLKIVASESRGQWLPYRAIYDRTVGENADNAYVRYLAAKPARRAKIKYVIRDAMTSFPGIERRKDGDHQSALVWYRQGGFTISSDPDLVGCSFALWRSALLEEATREARLWRLPEQRIVFRNQPDARSDQLGNRVALGVDPLGEVWAVQINEADDPGDANVLSAIALDSEARPHLIRQGRLNPNSQSRKTILYPEFRRLTGLQPINVTNGDTKIKRDWYVVTALDVDHDEIRRATGRFVDHCVTARTGGAGAGDPTDLELLADLYAADESGGTYIIGPREATDPRLVRKHQGEVWLQMATLLRAQSISVEKPRHAAGYAVDAEIVNKRRRLLVEIKSGASAEDVYGGMGQLQLYRKLLPRLADHRPILLLPDMPHRALVKAINECGVDLCTYITVETNERVDVTFSKEFLRLCGAKRSV